MEESRENQPTWNQILQQAGNTPPGYGGIATVQAAQKVSAELESLKGAIMVLSTNISSQTRNLNSGLSGATQQLIQESGAFEQQLRELNENIKEFSNSTSRLSSKANRLIWWYVILTFFIAVATILNLLKK